MVCKACSAILSDTDRFCPACGTPNTDGRLRPRLAPSFRNLVEPVGLAPVVAAGCPRCTRPIEPPDEFCRACGMALAAAWERLARARAEHHWRAPGPGNLERYRPCRPWLRPLWAALVAAVLVALAAGALRTATATAQAGWIPVHPARLDAMHDGIVLLSVMATVVAVVAYVALALWSRRAYRNLAPLGVGGLRLGIDWGGAAWFVPAASLVLAKLVLDDLWRGSDPHTPPLSTAWRTRPAPLWTAAAWAGAGAGVVLHLIGFSNVGDGLDGARGLLFGAAGDIGLMTAALSLLVLAVRVTDAQEVRADALGVTAPTLRMLDRRYLPEGDPGVVPGDALRPLRALDAEGVAGRY